MRELLEKYIKGETNAIALIRVLTGIVRMENVIDILAIINMVTRVEQGDLDKETFKSILLKESENVN
jgi:hypothetical protein